MKKAPWIKWSFRDWFSDFKLKTLSYEEKGVYLELLGFMWEFSEDQCSLPDDPIQLAKGLGIYPSRFKKIWLKIESLFLHENGQILSKRLKAETVFYRKLAEGGKHGNSKMLENKANRKILPSQAQARLKPGFHHREEEREGEERSNDLSIGRSDHSDDPKKGHRLEYSESFEKFWKAYPKKVRKKSAFSKWKNIHRLADLEFILQVIEKQKTWQSWIDGFIPDPERWLRDERWNDEEPPKRNSNGNKEIDPLRGLKQWVKQAGGIDESK